MAHPDRRATYLTSIYTPTGRRTLLTAIVGTAILIPSLITSHLTPVRTFFPVVAVLGIYLVRSGRPTCIPTWTIFNLFSGYTIIYAAFSFGTTFQIELLILFLLGMMVYDLAGVKGGQMQSMASKMIQYGVPLFVMVPHSRSFSFSSFREIVSEDGIEGLHESDHGVSMLGVGDGFLPGALAVAAGDIGTQFAVGSVTLSVLQTTTALGGIAALAILMWVELPRALAALIVSVPGALLGLAIGLLIDPTAISAFTVPQFPAI